MPRRTRPERAPVPGIELPQPTAREGRDLAALEASRRVVALFLREQRSDFSVRELAEHAGLSERTFYRYFPRKEDAIRPYVDAWIEEIVAHIRSAPRARSLPAVLIEAHALGFDAARDHDWEVLLPVLAETESLRAVWLQAVTNAEAAFAQVVAERLGIAPSSQQAQLCGAVLVTAGRLALASQDRLPGEVFADCLKLLGPSLFRSPPPSSAVGARSGPVSKAPSARVKAAPTAAQRSAKDTGAAPSRRPTQRG